MNEIGFTEYTTGKDFGAYRPTGETQTLEGNQVDEYYCESSDMFMYHFPESNRCEFLRPDGFPAPAEKHDTVRFRSTFVGHMKEVLVHGNNMAKSAKEAAKEEEEGKDGTWPEDADKA